MEKNQMILVVNAGSSNVKFAIYDQNNLAQLYRSQVASIQDVYTWLTDNKQQYQITAIGHRVVHGGNEFSAPIVITKNTISDLKKFIPLAPLHLPHNLAAIVELMKLYPDVPQIACFDTAFHTTQLAITTQFAIPQQLTAEGVIRYGFHGLSYEYIANVMEGKIGKIAQQRVIVAHLGNGSSMCAMKDKKSMATTMGFSALEGLMMGSRTGSIDPGVLLYLLQEKKYSADELSSFLYNKCGLLGVSNQSNDVRVLLKTDSEAAKLALDLYCYKAAAEFCKLLAPLGGCDAIIFTAGIGENAHLIRAGICSWLKWLGVDIDVNLNTRNAKIISTANSKLIVSVIPTDEELVIARHVRSLVH